MSFASWVSSADLGAEADEQLMSLASWEPSADRGAEPLGGLPGGAAGPGIAGDEDGWGPKKTIAGSEPCWGLGSSNRYPERRDTRCKVEFRW